MITRNVLLLQSISDELSVFTLSVNLQRFHLVLILHFLFDMTYEVDWALKTTYSREKQFCVVGKRETRVCDRTEESGSGI